jgi:hypothetical protein
MSRTSKLPAARSRLLIGVTLACLTGAALAQVTGRECALTPCAPGTLVVTSPSATSPPGCKTEEISSYVGFAVTSQQVFSGLSGPVADEISRTREQLRRAAGVKSLVDAAPSCVKVPKNQRARVLRLGAPKSGLAQIAPLDPSWPPYWLTTLDIEPAN